MSRSVVVWSAVALLLTVLEMSAVGPFWGLAVAMSALLHFTVRDSRQALVPVWA